MYAAAPFLRNSLKCLNLRTNAHLYLNRNICTSNLQFKLHRTPTGEVERSLVRKDNLDESYQIIYRAPMENYVTWTKNMSTATVSVLSLIAGYQIAADLSLVTFAQKMDLGVLVSHETDLYYFVAGFFFINVAIRTFVAKYPLRIYKSGEKYVAVFGSQLPVGTVKHHFERGQITEYSNFLNPWKHITYKLGNRTSMLLMDYFKTPAEFHQLFVKKEN